MNSLYAVCSRHGVWHNNQPLQIWSWKKQNKKKTQKYCLLVTKIFSPKEGPHKGKEKNNNPEKQIENAEERSNKTHIYLNMSSALYDL